MWWYMYHSYPFEKRKKEKKTAIQGLSLTRKIKEMDKAHLLKAVYDPKYKQPIIATITQLTQCACNGTSSVG